MSQRMILYWGSIHAVDDAPGIDGSFFGELFFAPAKNGPRPKTGRRSDAPAMMRPSCTSKWPLWQIGQFCEHSDDRACFGHFGRKTGLNPGYVRAESGVGIVGDSRVKACYTGSNTPLASWVEPRTLDIHVPVGDWIQRGHLPRWGVNRWRFFLFGSY